MRVVHGPGPGGGPWTGGQCYLYTRKFWYGHGCTGHTAFDSLVNKTTLTIIIIWFV